MAEKTPDGKGSETSKSSAGEHWAFCFSLCHARLVAISVHLRILSSNVCILFRILAYTARLKSTAKLKGRKRKRQEPNEEVRKKIYIASGGCIRCSSRRKKRTGTWCTLQSGHPLSR